MNGTSDVIIYEPDVLFSSKIESAAQRVGASVRVVANFAEVLSELATGKPRVLVLSLDVLETRLGDLEEFIKKSCSRSIGYYSHVNPGIAEKAKRVGVGIVLSRGAFLAKMNSLFEEFVTKDRPS